MLFRFCGIFVAFFVLPLFLSVGTSVSAQAQQASQPPVTEKDKHKGQSREMNGDWFLSRESEHDLHPVRLSATYYYGNSDKETVPVLLLHDLKGSREDFQPLTDMLSNAGYAVLAVDLRGHGASTKRYDITPPKIEMKPAPKNPINPSRGPKEVPVRVPGKKKLVDFKPDVLKPEDQVAILRADLPAFRRILENAHRDGLINMNRLVIVGVGRGAAAAACWATLDWRDKDSARYTKTLVLIDPAEMRARGDYFEALGKNKWIREEVAVMLAVPDGDKASQTIADKLRFALLESEDAQKAAAPKFPMYVINYPADRIAKTDKGDETKKPLTMVEILTNAGRAKLGKSIFDYIEQRNQSFPEKEERWTRLR